MPASRLRLLVATIVLVSGLALAPTFAADAAPGAQAVPVQDGAVARLTESERVLDATAQRLPDAGTRSVADDGAEPPLWLLVLLAPILIGGAIATGVTLRRLG